MRQNKRSVKRYYFLSPYLFSLTCFGLIGVLVLTVLCCYFLYKSGSDLRSIILVILPVIVYLIVGAMNAHEFWGIVCITDQELTVLAPFRKPLQFLYADIADIGIDYGNLLTHEQSWIYIGKRTVPMQYCHKINRLPINVEYARIQYSPKVFSDLYEQLPKNMKKRLENSQTILKMR